MDDPIHELLLHEQVLLLSLHDEEGTQLAARVGYAFAGGVIAELIGRRALRSERGSKDEVLVATGKATQGDDVLDDALRRVAAARRRASVDTWIGRFAQLQEWRRSAAEKLCERGILERREDKVLWVFPRTTWPTREAGPERTLVAALRQAVEGDHPVEPRVALLVALTHPVGILPHVLGRELVKEREARLDALLDLEAVGGATREAVEAANAAMVAVQAATSAAMTATVASS